MPAVWNRSRHFSLQAIIRILAESLLCWLGVGVLHQVLFLVLTYAFFLGARSNLIDPLVLALPVDHIHAFLVVRSFGEVLTHGLALGGPVGSLLLDLNPAFFGQFAVAGTCCLVSAVVDGASPVTAVASLRAAGLVLVLAAGTVILRKVAHGKLRFVGKVTVLYALLAIVALPWSLSHFESMGLSAFATKLLDIPGEEYLALQPTLAVTLPILVRILIAVTGLSLGVLITRRSKNGWRLPTNNTAPGAGIALLNTPFRWFVPVMLWYRLRRVVVVLSVLLLLFGLGVRGSLFLIVKGQSVTSATTVSHVPVQKLVGPSTVTIQRIGKGYQYRVNGSVEVVRGMGYNLVFRGETTEQRSARYHRDFAKMRDSGVNTIVGWDQARFGETLLAAAADEGMGVVLPFELPSHLDYSNPDVTTPLLDTIERWVIRYRHQPSLRMWGLGNEVIHDMDTHDPVPQRAFAQFLVRAADRIHALDPSHPVIYREAEDVYLPVIRAAMAEQPADRPWFVYGMNFYTFRLETVLATAYAEDLGMPLLVSEFGPFGLTKAARSQGYLKLLRMIDRYPTLVLGGFAYVWYQRGPEAVDNVFGLVDDDGNPVDDTLSVIAHVYRQSGTRTAIPTRVTNERSAPR